MTELRKFHKKKLYSVKFEALQLKNKWTPNLLDIKKWRNYRNLRKKVQSDLLEIFELWNASLITKILEFTPRRYTIRHLINKISSQVKKLAFYGLLPKFSIRFYVPAELIFHCYSIFSSTPHPPLGGRRVPSKLYKTKESFIHSFNHLFWILSQVPFLFQVQESLIWNFQRIKKIYLA